MHGGSREREFSQGKRSTAVSAFCQKKTEEKWDWADDDMETNDDLNEGRTKATDGRNETGI